MYPYLFDWGLKEAHYRISSFLSEAENASLVELAENSTNVSKRRKGRKNLSTISTPQRRLNQFRILHAIKAGELNVEEGLSRLTELDRIYQLG